MSENAEQQNLHAGLWSKNDWKGIRLGRYRIVELLSEEENSRTFLADDEILKRKVAFKTVSEVLSKGKESGQLKNFLREVQAAAVLQHPNIVCLYDVIHEAGVVAVAKEHFVGRTVEQLILDKAELTISQICEILADAAAGLAYAHENGMVHQDIKPASLILNHEGKCKVLDFGAAAIRSEEDTPTRRHKIDSPFFTSPEVIRGQPAVPASDVYALGVIMWWLLIGVPPYIAKTKKEMYRKHLEEPIPNITSARPDVPPALTELINKCLAKDPDRRISDCEDLAEKLRSISREAKQYASSDLAMISALVGAPQQAAPPKIKPRPRTEKTEPVEKTKPPVNIKKRKKIMLIAILAGSLALVIMAIVLIAILGSDGDETRVAAVNEEELDDTPPPPVNKDNLGGNSASYMRTTQVDIGDDFFSNKNKTPKTSAKQPVSTVTKNSFTGNKAPFIEEKGKVLMQAGDFDKSTAVNGVEWKLFRNRDSRNHCVRVPDKGGPPAKENSLLTTSPRLDYRVKFSKGGTYFVWVQGHGDPNGDSLHIGLDEKEVPEASRITVGKKKGWSRTNMSKKVARIPGITPGVHTINLWMREDGCTVTKILLTSDPKFDPSRKKNALSKRGS